MRALQLPPLTAGENIWEAPRKSRYNPQPLGAKAETRRRRLFRTYRLLKPPASCTNFSPGPSRFKQPPFLGESSSNSPLQRRKCLRLLSPPFPSAVLRKRRAHPEAASMIPKRTRESSTRVILGAETQRCREVIYSSLSSSLSSVCRWKKKRKELRAPDAASAHDSPIH